MDLDDFLALAALGELQKERATNLANENRLREENSQIKEKASNAEAVLRIKQGFTKGELDKSNSMIVALKQRLVESTSKLAELQRKVSFYEDLLKHNVETIATYNNDFDKTLSRELDLMSKWMISQKGFKEVAVQFGLELGYTDEQIIELGTNKSVEVINNLQSTQNESSKYALTNNERLDRVKEIVKNGKANNLF